jgi:hypothetical protein
MKANSYARNDPVRIDFDDTKDGRNNLLYHHYAGLFCIDLAFAGVTGWLVYLRIHGANVSMVTAKLPDAFMQLN